MYHTPPREDEDDLRSELQHGNTHNQGERRDWKMMQDRSPRFQRRRSRSRTRTLYQERSDTRENFRGTFQEKSPQRWMKDGDNPKFRSGVQDRDRSPNWNSQRGKEEVGRKVGRWERDDSGSDKEGGYRRMHRTDYGRKQYGRNKVDSVSSHTEPERKGRHRHKSQSRSRSSSGGHGDGRHRRKDHRERKKSASGVMTSKWARHHDHKSAELSTSEEDRELEKTFQQKRRKKEKSKGTEGRAQPDDEDLFGLNKFLPVL